MGAIKGYSSSKKSDDGQESSEYATINPIGAGRHGMDVRSFSSVVLVIADAVEASSTARVLNATAHVAKKGMIVEITSGPLSGEFASIIKVDANTITLGQELTAAPGLGVTFEIYRFALQKTTATGSITTVPGSRVKVDIARHDYSATAVTNAAYQEIIAATSAETTQIFIFDSSGETMVMAVGPASGEADQIYVFPGGFSGNVDLNIPAASRISIKAVSAANVNVGEFTINLLG